MPVCSHLRYKVFRLCRNCITNLEPRSLVAPCHVRALQGVHFVCMCNWEKHKPIQAGVGSLWQEFCSVSCAKWHVLLLLCCCAGSSEWLYGMLLADHTVDCTVCLYVVVNAAYVFKKIEDLDFYSNTFKVLSLLTIYWEECFLLGHLEGFGFIVCSSRSFTCAMLRSRCFLLPT